MQKIRLDPAALCAGALFLLLIPFSSAAAQGADEGLALALGTAIPAALLPAGRGGGPAGARPDRRLSGGRARRV